MAQPGNAPNPAKLPALPPTSPGDDWVVDFEDVQAYKKARAAGTNKRVLHDKWLASEVNWKFRIGKGWKGKKVLGEGGQGIVGHWTYEGEDRDQKTVKDLAVKQALRFGPAYSWGDGLESEARWLSMLARAKTPHIVKMYKHLFEEEGQRTFSQDWGLVQRIYLEFCPGGDLSGWLSKYIYNPRNISEEDLWSIFQCLARGVFAIHHGSEDPSSERYMPNNELVHFDLKPQNILIGDQTLDNEHRNQHPYKITDFGVAKQVPIDGQNAEFLRKWEYLGTTPWFAPLYTNLFNPAIRDPKYGSATNIWQIGLIMQTLMRRRRSPDWQNYTMYQSTATPRLANGGKTVGLNLDAEQDYLPYGSIYSRSLRNLIAECLLLTPASRPSPQELVKRTAEGTDTMQMSKAQILGPPLPQWQEPVVSAEWLQPDAVDPLAAALRRLQVQPANRPPVIPQPAPIVPAAAATAQAAATQASATQAGTIAPSQNVAAPAGDTQAAAAQARPSRPLLSNANAAPPRTLRVIVQTKSRFGGMVAGTHKAYTLRVTEATTVVQVKDMLDRQRCGIKVTSMNLMAGRTLMRDFQTLGEFPGLDNVRAMES
ncbi:kinase-like protein [Stipitochalara longipes BDJ]|nr:kinase-like protein [Stipitochalara longipes BDJ]